MSFPADKTIRERSVTNNPYIPSDFDKPEIYGTIEKKGYRCLYEKVYKCPCKSKSVEGALSTCKNCGGSGFLFCNPIITQMLIHSLSNERKYQQEGQEDLGIVQITAYEEDKLSQMDRITILDSVTEHTEILYPTFTDDSSTLFDYTKYPIKSIDYLSLYQGPEVKLKKLEEPADYSFRNNIVTLGSQYNNLTDVSLTIRYSHAPMFYIWNISRDSMRSTVVTGNGAKSTIILPVHAIGKRAHLIQEMENYDGSRVFDNSWLPNLCEVPELTKFERQLRYTSAQDIFDNLTDAQKAALAVLLP